jgi:hypothetical protein
MGLTTSPAAPDAVHLRHAWDTRRTLWSSPRLPPRHKHGQDRLCWLNQKRADQRFWIRCLEVRETEDISLVKLTPMVLEMDHHDLPNRVCSDNHLAGSSIRPYSQGA